MRFVGGMGGRGMGKFVVAKLVCIRSHPPGLHREGALAVQT